MFICLCWVKHHVPSALLMLRVFPLETHSWLSSPLWVLANDGVCLHHCYRSRSWKRPHYWCQAPKKAEWEKCSRKGWCHTVAHPRMSDSRTVSASISSTDPLLRESVSIVFSILISSWYFTGKLFSLLRWEFACGLAEEALEDWYLPAESCSSTSQ